MADPHVRHAVSYLLGEARNYNPGIAMTLDGRDLGWTPLVRSGGEWVFADGCYGLYDAVPDPSEDSDLHRAIERQIRDAFGRAQYAGSIPLPDGRVLQWQAAHLSEYDGT